MYIYTDGWLTYCFVELFIGWLETDCIDAMMVDWHEAEHIVAVMVDGHIALMNVFWITEN